MMPLASVRYRTATGNVLTRTGLTHDQAVRFVDSLPYGSTERATAEILGSTTAQADMIGGAL